jgi:hypothetical protein
MAVGTAVGGTTVAGRLSVFMAAATQPCVVSEIKTAARHVTIDFFFIIFSP